MTDVYDARTRSAVMRRVRGKDTAPELAVRRLLRAGGVGYRLGGCGLPGRPDVVMQGRRIALFVHGCFWHGHDCRRGARQPKANAAYWTAKIDRNRARDTRTAQDLAALGWRVITVWECEMKAADFGERLLATVRDQATAVAAPTSLAPDMTCDTAPSSDGGVSGLDTK